MQFVLLILGTPSPASGPISLPYVCAVALIRQKYWNLASSHSKYYIYCMTQCDLGSFLIFRNLYFHQYFQGFRNMELQKQVVWNTSSYTTHHAPRPTIFSTHLAYDMSSQNTPSTHHVINPCCTVHGNLNTTCHSMHMHPHTHTTSIISAHQTIPQSTAHTTPHTPPSTSTIPNRPHHTNHTTHHVTPNTPRHIPSLTYHHNIPHQSIPRQTCKYELFECCTFGAILILSENRKC